MTLIPNDNIDAACVLAILVALVCVSACVFAWM